MLQFCSFGGAGHQEVLKITPQPAGGSCFGQSLCGFGREGTGGQVGGRERRIQQAFGGLGEDVGGEEEGGDCEGSFGGVSEDLQ